MLSTRYRLISLAEFIAGSFVVIGHNVFHVVPNEVPILFVLFCVSFRLRDGGWRLPGLVKPKSWKRTVLLAFAAAAILQLGGELVIAPIGERIWPTPQHLPSVFKSPVHDWKFALRNLALIWTFAAFGEELGYRGYLLTRAADLGQRSRAAYAFAAFCVAALFGFGHYFKGPAGVLDSAYSGLVLGGVYVFSGRNLWAPILAHGISDSFFLAALMLGWAN